MKVGFTGTREGMTIDQLAQLELRLLGIVPTEWHDGDCVGADEQANRLVWSQSTNRGLQVEMHGHPCNLHKWRAHNEYDLLYPLQAPLVRNRHIVGASDLMFAAPKEFDMVMRGSGTWATIRYAMTRGVPLIIIFPDGSEERHNGA